ncbi:MAG: hypothetical protein ABI862_09105 [Ilumatobacteraceae bacterium]
MRPLQYCIGEVRSVVATGELNAASGLRSLKLTDRKRTNGAVVAGGEHRDGFETVLVYMLSS